MHPRLPSKSIQNEQACLRGRLSKSVFLSLSVSIFITAGCTTVTKTAVPLATTTVISSSKDGVFKGMPESDKQGLIAYIEEHGYGADKVSTLSVIRPDGSENKVITQVEQALLFSPAWSHDGNSLAYSVQLPRQHPKIFRYRLDKNEIEQVVVRQGLNLSPSFSPDDSQLLFSSSEAGNSDIYLKDLATDKIQRITTLPSTEVQPSYATDGKSFVYTSDKERAENPRIYRYNFETGHSTQVHTEGYAASPQLSLDNNKLAYLSGRNAAVMDIINNEIILLEPTGLDEPARLSPSGQYVVYPVKNDGNGSQLVLRPLYDSQATPVVLKKSGGIIRSPVWYGR